MSATDRIDEIARDALDAIERAPGTAELEDVRVRYLGRKAELPNLLRGVAQLAPEERAATGKAANRARQALEAAVQRRSEDLAGAELDARLAADRLDVTLPGDPLPAIGRLHLMTRTRREIEDVFIGLGFDVAEGPEIETVYYNFDTLNHAATHPSRLETDTFYLEADPAHPGGGFDLLDPATRLLRVHTSPTQVHAMERRPPPIYVIVPGRVYRPDSDATHTPQFHQVEGLAVDEGVTLADLQGTLLTFARAIFGDAREVRMRPHFFPFTEPSVEVDVSCFNCTHGVTALGRRCPLCKGTAWIEILGAGMVDPNVLAHVADNGYDPERGAGVRVRHGDRADRDAQARRPGPAPVLRQRRPLPGAVLAMRVPVSWLREYCSPELDTFALAERLAMTGTEVERVETHGVAALEQFVVGKVLEAHQHPDADRLRVCRVDTGDGEAQPDRLRRAQRRDRPDGRDRPARRRDARRDEAEDRQAARSALARDDPRRGRDRDRLRPRRDHGARRRVGAGHAARRGAPDRRRGARARDHLQPPRLPRCLRRRP